MGLTTPILATADQGHNAAYDAAIAQDTASFTNAYGYGNITPTAQQTMGAR